MNAPRFAAAALISALAAPAFAQTAALTPIPVGPAAAGQCVIGSESCGLARGAAMDPVGEAALVGLGQSMVPPLGGDSSGRSAADKKTAPSTKTPDLSESADAGTDLVAIGGQIINPLGAGAPVFRSATGMNLNASAAAAEGASMRPRQATFDTHVDGSAIPTPSAAKPTGLSYTQMQKVEATLGGKGAAFGTDPKLSAGDGDFSAGGTRAAPNR
jgi:hypothetical protein